MPNPTVALIGDSYVSSWKTWTQNLQKKLPGYSFRILGKGGSNQFYAINQWRQEISGPAADKLDTVFFTFTWPRRLYHSHMYRNDQICAYSELRDLSQYGPDPVIKSKEDVIKFKESLDNYYRYIFDSTWSDFDYELELKWILDLPAQYPHIKFIFLPNHAQARHLAKKYFHHGLLVDFAFEEISNREPNSPGPMQVNCGRPGHMNPTNHELFAERMVPLILDYERYRNKILEFDLSGFDIV